MRSVLKQDLELAIDYLKPISKYANLKIHKNKIVMQTMDNCRITLCEVNIPVVNRKESESGMYSIEIEKLEELVKNSIGRLIKISTDNQGFVIGVVDGCCNESSTTIPFLSEIESRKIFDLLKLWNADNHSKIRLVVDNLKGCLPILKNYSSLEMKVDVRHFEINAEIKNARKFHIMWNIDIYDRDAIYRIDTKDVNKLPHRTSVPSLEFCRVIQAIPDWTTITLKLGTDRVFGIHIPASTSGVSCKYFIAPRIEP